MVTRLIWSNDGTDPPDVSAGRPRPPAEASTPNAGWHSVLAGTSAPDFRLHDQRGNRVTLRALLLRGAVVLRFCRNENTATCIREFNSLSALHSDVIRLGATLAVIAIEPLDPHPLSKDAASFPFSILRDVDGNVAQSYGLNYTAPSQDSSVISDSRDDPNGERKIMFAPATYVIDRRGMVAVAFIDVECRSLMDHGQILMALECLGRRK
jgi:peroxiredoxin